MKAGSGEGRGWLHTQDQKMAPTPIQSSAPGKIILFGEHAVVYGRPAIAVPITHLRATATIGPAPPGSGLTLVARDLGTRVRMSTASSDHSLAAAARATLDHLCLPQPDATVTIRSTIPIASGMGSGAAVAAALVRALATFLGRALERAEISQLVFEVEKIHHGTPSGIDNTVVVYEEPMFFQRGRPVERLSVGAPVRLLVGDTGIRSSTRAVVQDVRRHWKQDPPRYNALFDRVGGITCQARRAIETGTTDALGPLMDKNHELLTDLGVSSGELDDLVDAARFAGALGAKLSGAGRGGNMIALVEEGVADDVERALRNAGAVHVIGTMVS